MIVEAGIYVVADEIYCKIIYDEAKHLSIAAAHPDSYKYTFISSGFAKAYAMTGWRLGYALGPASVVEAMTKMHQYVLMCAPTTSQYGAISAMKNGDSDIREMRKAYDGRRKLMIEGFRKMGLSCFEPKGAFYVFPSIKETGMTSTQFCEKLLEEERVAVVPGTAFGASGEGHIRCSYAYSLDELKEALVRIERFVSRYING